VPRLGRPSSSHTSVVARVAGDIFVARGAGGRGRRSPRFFAGKRAPSAALVAFVVLAARLLTTGGMPAGRSEKTATHCPYCALQCGVLVDPGPPDRTTGLSLVGNGDFPVNAGALCIKG
jgi:anaerobic selenocysteine-containing dehydrogenase